MSVGLLREAAREAAAYAAERAIAAGVGTEEAERIAERAARTAAREVGEMATIARAAVAAAPAPKAVAPVEERRARYAHLLAAGHGYTAERAAELAFAMFPA